MHRATALALAVVLLRSLSPSLWASNWGALDADHRCTVTDRLSQCTANNGVHLVWIESSLMTQLKTATLNTMEEDYEPIDDIIADETSYFEYADVQVYDLDFDTDEFAGYTTCSVSAAFGGSGVHRWCRPQLVFYNLYFEDSYFEDAEYRRWLACHEVGHTLGLRHANQDNHPNPSNSCMKNVHYGPEDASQHDANHLADEY